MKKEVVAFFKKNPRACLKARQLAKKLDIMQEHEYQSLKAVLHQLTVEKILDRKGKKFCVFAGDERKAITGQLQITRQGFGFVIPDSKKLPDIFIAERNLSVAMNGDTVEVELFARQKQNAKNLEGEITKLVKRKWDSVTGILRRQRNMYFVTPDIPDFHKDILVDFEEATKFKIGSRVLVGDIEWTSVKLSPEGRILKELVKNTSFEDDYIGIIHEHGLRTQFPLEVLNEAEQIPQEIPAPELKKRRDYRAKTVVTIDPEDAKDFDDALSIETLENGNYSIGIHIADVSHYVEMGGKLDIEARLRGNSVYLPGKVLPMLPERLSNGICSLNPHVDRLTYSCIVELTPRGKVENFEFCKTVINSRRRFTYEEVQKIITGAELPLPSVIPEIPVVKSRGRKKASDAGFDPNCKEEVLLLHRLSVVLRRKRMREGSINFETPEIRFVFGEGTLPLDIKRRVTDDSHNLVEEFMLLANKLLAQFVKDKTGRNEEIPFVYRVHDLPSEDKQQDFLNLLRSLGYKNIPPRAPVSPKDLNKIIETVHGKPEEVLVNELAVRSMAKAEYSTDNIGHYGLGFKNYTHFTSPIRRYSDLLAHRVLTGVISGKKQLMYGKTELTAFCEHISATERTAVEAERGAIRLKQIQFLKGFVGEEFHAVISGVTNYGLFVEIADYLAEGLIRLRDLESDYFLYDEKKYSLTGRHTGKTYRLGDTVSVRLIRVDEMKLTLDFMLLED
ncbi:MAG: ribonuclease R [Ignavibacteria bacterium]|nr:ribonuclease R [Ignavibacteria bacterium]